MGKRSAVDENSWTPVDVSMDLGVNGFSRRASHSHRAAPQFEASAAPVAVLDEVVPVRSTPPEWALAAARSVEFAREEQARRTMESSRAARATQAARAAQAAHIAEVRRTAEIEQILMAGIAAQTPAEGIDVGFPSAPSWSAPLQQATQPETDFDKNVHAEPLWAPESDAPSTPAAHAAAPIFDKVATEEPEDLVSWEDLHSPRRAREEAPARSARAWTLIGIASAIAAGGIVTMGLINPEASGASEAPRINVTSGKGTPLESDDGNIADDEVTAGSQPAPTNAPESIELSALWGTGDDALDTPGKATLPFTITAGASGSPVDVEVSFELPAGVQLLDGSQGDCTSVEQAVTCSGIGLAPQSSFEGTVDVLVSTSGHELPALTTVAKPQA